MHAGFFSQTFGFEFRQRLAYYTVYTVIVALAMFTMVLVQLVAIRTANPSGIFSVLFTLPVDAAATICVSGFALLVTSVALGAMVWYGSKANQFVKHHSGALVRVQMQLRAQRLQKGGDMNQHTPGSGRSIQPPVSSALNKDLDALIDGVLTLLEIEDDTDPITIIGIRASTELMNLYIALLGALVTLTVFMLESVSS